ncbi:response regulator [Noviherbaspirillum suwonense]|jgi:DNA-binding NarL/FixJ family response regulator|uniref:Two component transcriptional regulator, LuxR family n=1 Tax=Noviherbaspirillum suwonense TaxID=1224511 RepID=A0ABY1QC98_9BURK|nr:response regulator transcription factor [Noviherbaspirillum suwonense]SMP67139.1 two component transcriptional regulator, LuxR family [Noviherbaspirillum suwonense]
MPESVRVLVVDDHPLFRQGVVQSLNTAPDIAVVGEAASGEEALRLATELMPDIMLLDMSMPGWNGLETMQKVSMVCPATGIVILTVSEEKDMLMGSFKAGARAYVLKGVAGQELVQVVRAVAAGEVYVPPSLAAEILVSLGRRPALDPLQELTVREHEILALIGAGLTNRAIGERLQLSEKTIKHYVTNIFQKLQVRSRVEAALLAVKHAVRK